MMMSPVPLPHLSLGTYHYKYTVAVGGEEDAFETKTGVRQWEKIFLGEEFKMMEYPSTRDLQLLLTLLHTRAGGFPRGAFSFPFQYQLPHGVPGAGRGRGGREKKKDINK